MRNRVLFRQTSWVGSRVGVLLSSVDKKTKQKKVVRTFFLFLKPNFHNLNSGGTIFKNSSCFHVNWSLSSPFKSCRIYLVYKFLRLTLLGDRYHSSFCLFVFKSFGNEVKMNWRKCVNHLGWHISWHITLLPGILHWKSFVVSRIHKKKTLKWKTKTFMQKHYFQKF